ncbi:MULTISPECIES: endonuclease III [Acidithrix]|uniref:Endonuclease III n=1 Tax=Acidithrix ferrooxidans TaxID=1280514 RepID=A0A0D8HEJ6_9ACTN|nr:MULTISPECIES: endonuclease III [Acidithrix]KJF16333.1 ultraviolet N-glycosylase/AP lyase [Acidithrix ferrooxidans]CAG4922689.1 unnamed protein product [Acidithrix sp. C25]
MINDGFRDSSEDERRAEIIARLRDLYPGTARELCELDFSTPFQLLAATILSAQCTDKRVNMVTPKLFESYGTPTLLASADIVDVEEIIKSTGFYHNKAKNLIAMARSVLEGGGELPNEMEGLSSLAGVGRKTANVVLSVAFDKPGLPVDTHVMRLSKLLGFTTLSDPVKIELELNEMVPPRDRGALSLRMILHGRAVCVARKPRCHACALADLCPAFIALAKD